MLSKHLQVLCKELEIDPLKEVDSGTFEFPLDEDHSVTITDMQPGAYFFATLCETPRVKREELFTLLMVNNLFGSGTDHAVLGMDARGEKCVVSLALKDASDYRTFRDRLEDFVNQVDFWAEEIQTYVEGG